MNWFSEWHLVNIVLPAALPVAVLLVLWFFPLPSPHHHLANPWVAVKDGQLAWAALGMCTTAFYEFRHPAQGIKPPPEWENVFFWVLLGATSVSALYAAVAPVFPTSTTRPIGILKNVWHFRVFFGSVILVGLTGWLYSAVHLTTQTI